MTEAEESQSIVAQNLNSPFILGRIASRLRKNNAYAQKSKDGHGTHPRSEVKGLSAAVDRFLGNDAIAALCAEPISKPRSSPQTYVSSCRD